MTIRLRSNETGHWAAWVSDRYLVAAVEHRNGVHFALKPPRRPVTLCMRPADFDPNYPVDQSRLCSACRAAAHVAYLMAHPEAA